MSSSAVSRCFEAEAAATNTRFTGLRATAAWRPRQAWPAPTNASFAGGKILLQFYFGMGALFHSALFLKARAVLLACPFHLGLAGGRVWKGAALLPFLPVFLPLWELWQGVSWVGRLHILEAEEDLRAPQCHLPSCCVLCSQVWGPSKFSPGGDQWKEGSERQKTDTSPSTTLQCPLLPALSTWWRFGFLWRSLSGTPVAPGALEIVVWLVLCKATEVLSAASIFVLRLDHFSYFKYLHPYWFNCICSEWKVMT